MTTAATQRGRRLSNLDPVINAKPFDALKFTEVIANKCQSLAAHMTSNYHVMKPDRAASAFEICTKSGHNGLQLVCQKGAPLGVQQTARRP